jgi:hypothetical protein
MARVYGVAAVGLPPASDWGYKLAWVPGSLLVFHSRCAWHWEIDDRRAAGQGIRTDPFGLAWCPANLISQACADAAAWIGPARHTVPG